MIFSFRMNDFTKSVRFAGTQRLFGEDGLARLGNARVAIIGIGGVGSWAVETLARTGIGNLTLIDGDVVVESNINRQIQATDSTLGKPKGLALAERIARINPVWFVEPLQDFVRPENLDALVGNRNFDFVIDAIDSVRDKTALIAYCKEKAIPLVTVGSAGGQMDPTRIDICDLSRTQQEPLLAKVRKRLRSQYGFTRNPKNKFGIDAVYSLEPVKYPGNAEPGPKENVPGLNPAGFGTTMAVTAGFGLAAASYVLRRIALAE